jgi:Methyltransferase domain
MLIAQNCPGCGDRRLYKWPALVSSFIWDYVLSGSVSRCNLCECLNCGLRFFDLRYTDAEMQALYADYRGERYVRIRRQHEPNYDNDAAIGDIPTRLAGLDAFFRRYAGETSSKPAFDFGGDDGRLIPGFFTGKRYVYDVTDKPLVPGVERIADLGSLRAQPPMFVLLCHVLEHLSEPAKVLETISTLLPSHEKLYVEVPNERYRLRWLGPPRFYRRWFNFMAQKKFAAPIVNLSVGHLRRSATPPDSSGPGIPNQRKAMLGQIRRFLPAVEDLRLHEHINFFDERSLRALLEQTGFRVLALQSESAVYRLLAERI